MEKETFYTVKQASDLLKVHTNTIYRQIGKGKLKALTLGGTFRIAHSAIMQMEGTKAKSSSLEWDKLKNSSLRN